MNRHNESLESINTLKEEIERATKTAVNRYEAAVKWEIERIGNLKTSEVTVAEHECVSLCNSR